MSENTVKFFDSELKVMNLLWDQGELPASDISRILEKEIGWKRNTTYTIIKKCIMKGGIRRIDPGFMCCPLITKEVVQNYETNVLIDKLFKSSNEEFLTAFMSNQDLTDLQIERLKSLIDGRSLKRNT